MFEWMQILAQNSPSSIPEGTSGWISAGVIVSACAALWKWLYPRLDKAFDCVPKLEELCARNTHSLDELAIATTSLASNFGMLSRLVSAQAAACMLQTKRVLLLVEDSVIDSRLLMGILGPVSVKYKLVVIPVMSMEEALPQIPQACLMILDVNLPDANLDTIRSLIEVCPCPVIVHSASTYTQKDFPGARGIVEKGGPSENITSLIETIRLESKR